MVEFCIFAVHRKETAAAKKESRINKIILVVKQKWVYKYFTTVRANTK